MSSVLPFRRQLLALYAPSLPIFSLPQKRALSPMVAGKDPYPGLSSLIMESCSSLSLTIGTRTFRLIFFAYNLHFLRVWSTANHSLAITSQSQRRGTSHPSARAYVEIHMTIRRVDSTIFFHRLGLLTHMNVCLLALAYFEWFPLLCISSTRSTVLRVLHAANFTRSLSHQLLMKPRCRGSPCLFIVSFMLRKPVISAPDYIVIKCSSWRCH